MASMQARAKKRKISITLDENLIAWLDQQTKTYVFHSRSEGIERSVLALKREMEKEET